jgi:hypothetical protein
LLSRVNPKTDAEKCDRIRIGAILRLEDDENRAGLLLKPRCLAEEERADIDFFLARTGHAATLDLSPLLDEQRKICALGEHFRV